MYAKCFAHLLRSNYTITTRGAVSISRLLSTTTKPYISDGDIKYYDVIVVGGGLVGSSAACALGQSRWFHNKHILLLEAANPTPLFKLQPNYSNRVVSISPATQKYLTNLGVWPVVEGERFQPVYQLQVWDACSNAHITFENEHFESPVSCIVENDVLTHALKQQLEQLTDVVTIKYSTRVKSLHLPQSPDALAEIELENGEKIQTRLLVGADGFRSRIRETMGVQYVNWNYDQVGLVATLKLSEPAEGSVAWQRFLPNGPLALLPLSPEYYSLVWSTSPVEASQLMAMDDSVFVDSVNQALWTDRHQNNAANSWMQFADKVIASFGNKQQKHGRQLPPSISELHPKSRAVFPLGFGHAVYYAKPRAVLVGDAAHRIHPLAGLGVNLGFEDVACLVKKLEESVANGQELGILPPLLKYETERQKKKLPTMIAIDGMKRLYGNNYIPVVGLRSVGLSFVHALPMLKKQIMAHASI